MASYSALLRSPIGKNWPTVLWRERGEEGVSVPVFGLDCHPEQEEILPTAATGRRCGTSRTPALVCSWIKAAKCWGISWKSCVASSRPSRAACPKTSKAISGKDFTMIK